MKAKRIIRTGQGLAITCILVLATACSPTDPEPIAVGLKQPVLQVGAGGEMLEGEMLDPQTGLLVFRGIPFAAPPEGELRWKPPEPHVARQGVQDASQFGPACPQLQGNPAFYRFVA